MTKKIKEVPPLDKTQEELDQYKNWKTECDRLVLQIELHEDKKKEIAKEIAYLKKCFNKIYGLGPKGLAEDRPLIKLSEIMDKEDEEDGTEGGTDFVYSLEDLRELRDKVNEILESREAARIMTENNFSLVPYLDTVIEIEKNRGATIDQREIIVNTLNDLLELKANLKPIVDGATIAEQEQPKKTKKKKNVAKENESNDVPFDEIESLLESINEIVTSEQGSDIIRDYDLGPYWTAVKVVKEKKCANYIEVNLFKKVFLELNQRRDVFEGNELPF